MCIVSSFLTTRVYTIHSFYLYYIFLSQVFIQESDQARKSINVIQYTTSRRLLGALRLKNVYTEIMTKREKREEKGDS